MSSHLSRRDLDTVRLVAEYGSLTETARLMHVSQPAVSQRLAAVEQRVGTELFVRRSDGMHATPAARRLATAAVSIDRIIGQAIDEIEGIASEREHQLRITTQCHTCYRWLSFVIRELVERFPDINIDVVPEAIEDTYGAIERDEVDIAIINHPEPTSPLRPVPLFDDELFAVMRHDHRLAARKILMPENFRDATLVLYAGERFAFVDDILRPAGVRPARIRQVRITEAIVELARAGQGIAVLAGWVLNDLPSKRELAAVRITRGGYRRRWQALVNPQCSPEYATQFIEIVRKTAVAISDDNWRRQLEVG
ncbi:MAG: LysR family transcriptional regulator [Gammaproteobacteria bacterium]